MSSGKRPNPMQGIEEVQIMNEDINNNENIYNIEGTNTEAANDAEVSSKPQMDAQSQKETNSASQMNAENTVQTDAAASQPEMSGTSQPKTDNQNQSEASTMNQPEINGSGQPDINAAGQPDPYSKYNFYQPYQNAGYQNPNYQNNGYQNPNPGFQNQNYQNNGFQNTGYQNTSYQANGYQNQGYQNSGYQNQAYQNQGYQNQGYQASGYSSNAPQYNGAYANNGYQQGYSNPYPTGQISYVNNIDSIYPGTAPHRTTKKKEKSKAAKFFSGVAMSVAFGLIAAGVFILVTYIYKQQNPELFSSNSQQVQVTTSENKNNQHLNLDPAEGVKVPSTSIIDGATFTGTDVSNVVEANMPAIVAIDCITQTYNYWYGTYDTPSAGSGIIIEKTDKELMIATNNHVVSNTKDIKVKFIDGTTAPASIKGKDEVADLAVLTIKLSDISADTLAAISVAKTGNSDEIKVGEMAIAIGNALGYGQSVTVGYISGKDREITIENQKFSGLLQTDAAINPGNSGGALLNIKGEVIGINNAKISGSDVEGMGYAIPISKAQDILNDFISRETIAEEDKGYLGISIETVTSSMAQMYNWPVGVYVAEIAADSAAQKGGLLVGDIITAINGVSVTTNSKLIELVQSKKYGTEITMTVQRRIDGEFQEMTLTITLGRKPVETEKSADSNDKTVPDQKTPETNKPDAVTPKEKPSEGDFPDDFNPSTIFPDGSLPEDFDPETLFPDGSNPFSELFPGMNIPGSEDGAESNSAN